MSDGNGFDIGSLYGLMVEIGKAVSRQEVAIASLQDEVRQIRSTMATMATKADLAELRAELKGDIAALRAELKAEIAELRQDVAAYHASVVGHGILISELEARMGRVEQHLQLPPFVHG